MNAMAYRIGRALSCALLLAVVSACGSPPTLPTAVEKTEEFSGTVQVGGSSTKTFRIDFIAPTYAIVTVKTLTSAASGAALGTTIGVAFGSNDGSGGCIKAAPATQQAATVGTPYKTIDGLFPGEGDYCVQVFDAGTLTQTANYTISVTHF
jgi:hypothetical protein